MSTHPAASPADPDDGPVRIRYFLRIPNVGDRVNPLVIGGLSGTTTRHVPDADLPHLLAIGSLMKSAAATSLVWGTGLLHPDGGLGGPRPENIFAVRGPLTATALRRAGLLVHDVPLGDPGSLAPALLGITAAREPRFPLGLVAHYVDRGHPAVRRLLAMPGVRDLDVRWEPADFLSAMADCRAIVSSSLHGLVFAEALGLPTLWFQATGDVAGDGFKFRDWFSTTHVPQASPYTLDGGERPEQLAGRAERRGSRVSSGDLAAAFPRSRLAEIRDRRPCRVAVRVARHPRTPLPVFVISFNRGRTLLRCLAGLRHLSRPTIPVIHDNGSTDPATLEVLAALEADGVAVHRGPRLSGPADLAGVNRTIAAFFADWSEPCRYAVTDCDIDLSVADPTAIDVYDELLDAFRGRGCVGPLLRIRDVSRHHPLFNGIMNDHVARIWNRRPTWVDTSHGRLAVQECLIDTTFAVHRAGEPFQRLKPGLGVYEPYEALHLDWYDDTRTLDPSYAETSCATVARWNNRERQARDGGEPLYHDVFHAVRRTPSGGLEEYVCHSPSSARAGA